MDKGLSQSRMESTTSQWPLPSAGFLILGFVLVVMLVGLTVGFGFELHNMYLEDIADQQRELQWSRIVK